MGRTAAQEVLWWVRLKLVRTTRDGEQIYKCPGCNGFGFREESNYRCRVCQGEGTVKLFLCEGCGEWVPHAFGAADNCSNYCDTCWANQDAGRPV